MVQLLFYNHQIYHGIIQVILYRLLFFSGSGIGITNLDYNNITNKPDLTIYAIKSNVDSSLNTLVTNKQDNLTFSNPFLNSSNTISLKYNSTQFNIDSSGNLSSSQWTTSGTKI
jgi:hypothetical protein